MTWTAFQSRDSHGAVFEAAIAPQSTAPSWGAAPISNGSRKLLRGTGFGFAMQPGKTCSYTAIRIAQKTQFICSSRVRKFDRTRPLRTHLWRQNQSKSTVKK